MDIYEYVALSDEYGTRAICNKYGVDTSMVETSEQMSYCLQQVVGEYGESAMVDILNLHPDKDLIIETFGKEKKKSCGCSDAKSDNALSAVASSFSSIKESHLFIFAGAMLIAAAIISK